MGCRVRSFGDEVGARDDGDAVLVGECAGVDTVVHPETEVMLPDVCCEPVCCCGEPSAHGSGQTLAFGPLLSESHGGLEDVVDGCGRLGSRFLSARRRLATACAVCRGLMCSLRLRMPSPLGWRFALLPDHGRLIQRLQPVERCYSSSESPRSPPRPCRGRQALTTLLTAVTRKSCSASPGPPSTGPSSAPAIQQRCPPTPGRCPT
jgi:hypothetical protein